MEHFLFLIDDKYCTSSWLALNEIEKLTLLLNVFPFLRLILSISIFLGSIMQWLL